MQNIKPKTSPLKILRNIVLTVFVIISLVYLIFNIVFWNKGMPEQFFKYELIENNTVQIDQYKGPFFLLNIPDTIEGKPVTSIGSQIFEETLFDNGKIVDTKRNIMQRYVTAVHLPATVEEIHFAAFEDCRSLRTINIPPKLSYTGWHILAGTRVKKLVFPEGITEIGCGYDYDLGYEHCHETFADMTYLREVSFPESLKKIGNNAFAYCKSLKKITLPDGVEEIEYGAFQGSGLTEANIPKSLLNNCGCVFIGTPYEESLAKQASDGFIILNDVLLYKYVGDDENVVIPDGIESICDRAFWTAKNVKTVEIPESVRYINGAFEYSSIESLAIPDTVDAESYMAFYSCYNLKEIKLPDKMTKIQACAFEDCTSLESIQLPKNAKSIGNSAFSGCCSLKNITIPDCVEEIGDEAFIGCSALEDVVFSEKLKKIGKSAFKRCTALKKIKIPDGVEEINAKVFSGCSSLKEIILSDNISKIPSCAFWGSKSLESIQLPKNLKVIDDSAFENCTSLKKIVVPEGTEEIGKYAFDSCNSLEEVILPESLKMIGEKTFWGCEALRSITLPDKITTIPSQAFCKCESLESIQLSKNTRVIEKEAFWSCQSLKKLVIPESVEEIQYHAFIFCTSLEDVIMEGSPSLGEEIFTGCDALKNHPGN